MAAPTAGLHFTKSLLNGLMASGIEIAALTLHVGYGTFAPIRCVDIRQHRMHPEFIEIGKETADAVNRAKRERRRVVAVGTTVVRTLEWAYRKGGRNSSLQGYVRSLHLSGLPICGCRLHGDQLSSPKVQPDPAGIGFRRAFAGYCPPIGRRSGSAIVSSATEMQC